MHTSTKPLPVPPHYGAAETRFGHRQRRGHAVIEVALLAPWLLFLFIGIFDAGFYMHALIATENAARAAATYTSRSSLTADNSAGACRYALDELQAMSNVRGRSTCGASPLIVTASKITDADGWPASLVSVTYRTDRMIPVLGIMGQLNVTRTVQMLVK
jgi:Flp pilus assembly protein TadG